MLIVKLSGIYGSKPTESEGDSPRTRFVYEVVYSMFTITITCTVKQSYDSEEQLCVLRSTKFYTRKLIGYMASLIFG